MKKDKEERKAQAKDRRLFKTYGVTLVEYEAQVKRQEGKCIICDKVPNRSLCIDHIHVPGFKKLTPEEKRKYVRLLVCSYCNLRIVGAVDRPNKGREMFNRLINYFDNFNMKSDVL